jgi:HK97 family phage prohead protease
MEKRSFNIAEFRFLSKRDRDRPDNEDELDEENEDDEDEDRQLASGYASVYNSMSEDLGGFREIIAPTAFQRSLSEARNGDANIYAYWAHDAAQPIGSTRSKTLSLNSDDKGLAFTLDPERLNTMQSKALQAGDMRMSFGFVVPAGGDSWTPDYSVRTIHDVQLMEVSPVTEPAYSATSAGMRSLADTAEARASMARAKEDRAAAEKLIGEVGPEIVSLPSGSTATFEAGPLTRAAEDKPYGDVKYADPKNGKYPIDTEEHIRAAWNYIHHPNNADEYTAAEAEEIKSNIIAAWKKVIDPKGPPSAEEKSHTDTQTEHSNKYDSSEVRLSLMRKILSSISKTSF